MTEPLTRDYHRIYEGKLNASGSKLPILGMAMPTLIGKTYNGSINPYYWVDDHSLLYGNHRSLDPSTYTLFTNKPRNHFWTRFLWIKLQWGSQFRRGCSLPI